MEDSNDRLSLGGVMDALDIDEFWLAVSDEVTTFVMQSSLQMLQLTLDIVSQVQGELQP